MEKELKLKILEEVQIWTVQNDLETSSEMDIDLTESIANRFEAMVRQGDSSADVLLAVIGEIIRTKKIPQPAWKDGIKKEKL